MNDQDREIFIHRIADQALTEYLSVEEWRKYFDRGWHKTKAILLHTSGCENFDTLYRIPLKQAPPSYLKKKGFFSDASRIPSESECGSVSHSEKSEN